MQPVPTDPLAQFQDGFVRLLLDPDAPPDPDLAALAAQPAFAVYRNTVMKGCIDALQANFPAVARLTGEEWFRAAAAIYVRETPPAQPTLLHYGNNFADFLARFPPAAELPYLPGVARLDGYWTEAHTAADAAPLDPAVVAALSPEKLASILLHPHPAARWGWFAECPIYTIWSRNRAGDSPDGAFDWCAEGALLSRPREAVRWRALGRAGCAFLDACAAGATAAQATAAALRSEHDADLAGIMQALLEAGALAGITSI